MFSAEQTMLNVGHPTRRKGAGIHPSKNRDFPMFPGLIVRVLSHTDTIHHESMTHEPPLSFSAPGAMFSSAAVAIFPGVACPVTWEPIPSRTGEAAKLST